MSEEIDRSRSLVAVLSILGIIAIALVAGLLLFQKNESGNPRDIVTALSSRETDIPGDDFDPISWAREGAAYPPLEEPDDEDGEYVADYTGEGAIPGDDESPDEVTVTRQPAAVSPPPAASPEPRFREVTEQAWWIQVGSWQNAANAQRARDELAEAGFPARIIARDTDGVTMYRVRIGAYDNEAEAEDHAARVRGATVHTSSYVTKAWVTRRIPVDG